MNIDWPKYFPLSFITSQFDDHRYKLCNARVKFKRKSTTVTHSIHQALLNDSWNKLGGNARVFFGSNCHQIVKL